MKVQIKQIILWTLGLLMSTMVRLSLGQMYEMYDLFESSPVMVGGEELVNVTVDAGKTAVLPCIVKNLGVATVNWLDAEMRLIPGNNTPNININTSEPNNYNLVIENADSQHSGKYFCMVNIIPPLLKPIHLEVKAPPRINKTKLKGQLLVREGQDLHIDCDVTGSPQLSVIWYAMDQEKKNVKEQLTDNGTLVITNVQSYHAGIYSCEAGNKYGTDMFEVYVKVTFRPRIGARKIYQKVKEGESTAFNCYISSSPHAKAFWQFVGPTGSNTLQNGDKYLVRDFKVNQTLVELELTISNIQKSDNGLYKCLAVNKLGFSERGFHLLVESTTTTTAVAVTQPPTTATTTSTSTTSTTTTLPPETSPQETTTLTSTETLTKNQVYEVKEIEKGDNGPKTGSSMENGASYYSNGFQIFYSLCLLFIAVYL